MNGVQKSSVTIAYDGLNLLSGCAMTVGTGATATSDSRWSERNIRYDLDGNLLHLERYQEMVTDNGFIQWNGSAASSRMQSSVAFPISVLQAKLFCFAVAKNRIGHGPRCRHSRSRRAIHRCSNDGAASIPKSGLEIKNRCTLEGVNRQNLASIRKFGLEIKNRCTKDGINRQNLASIRKSGLEIKNRCTQGAVNRENLASIRKSGPEIRNRCSNKAFSGHSLQRFPNSPPKIKNHCTDRAKTRAIPAAIAKFTP